MRNRYRILFITLTLISLNLAFITESQSSDEPLKIGIYYDRGVHQPGKELEYVENIKAIFTVLEPNSHVLFLKAKDIINTKLKSIDVIIFPGGSGGKQSKSLGFKGRTLVKQFVKRGGGFIGICGGAYLGQSTKVNGPNYCLGISSAVLFDKARHWNRGEGLAKIYITDFGKKIFPELKDKSFLYIYYNNGPLLAKKKKRNSYKEIMGFQSNIFHNIPASFGESIGKTFILKDNFGKGLVILVSGHPEATPGFTWLLPRMVRLAGKRELINYKKRFINPSKFNKEIMFTRRWRAKEHKLLTIVKCKGSCNPQRITRAIDSLKKMASRKLREILPSLLLHKEPTVRISAAKSIIFYDYFGSMNQLKRAYHYEKNRSVKNNLFKVLQNFNIEPQ